MNGGIHLATLAAATLLFASCSGSNDEAVSSTSATEASTTAAADAPTLPVDPTIPSTSPSETATASTVLPSPPTTDPTSTSVVEGLIASREAYLYAVYNLDAVDALDRLNSTHAAGSPSLALALDNVQTLVDNGWLARPNPDVPDTVTIESDVTMLDETTAELIACVVGAGEVFAPGAGDGGADLLVNGEIEAALNRVTMVLEDGRWKLQSGTNISTEAGTACVPE